MKNLYIRMNELDIKVYKKIIIIAFLSNYEKKITA